MWQDAVITTASVFFALSLLPQVYFGWKEKSGPIKFQTSIPTSLGLYVSAIAYWSLSLKYSAVMSLVTGTLWLILIMQRIKYKK